MRPERFSVMRPKALCDIARFQERDIDLMLAEELRVNPGFSRWFIEQGGGAFQCSHPAVKVEISAVEDGSEADIAALFDDSAGNKLRLFVENKITAQKMPEQLERYVRRAKNEVARGVTIGWAVKLFTPRNYWSRSCPEGVQHISFEAVADFMKRSTVDPRAEYRANFLFAAASSIRSQSERDLYNAETQPFIKEWWDAVYDRLEEMFPGYFIHKTKYPASVYFAPATLGFPSKWLRVDFKGHKGEVDLAFKNCDPKRLSALLRDMPDCPGRMVINGKSAAIQISGLPKFVIADGLSIIESHVVPSYKATYDLIEFWKSHESDFRPLFEN